MAKISAGLILYRKKENRLEVLLIHPGGPFWVKKDLGAWSIPKGEIGSEEDHLAAAKREFEEEVGFAPAGEFLPLGSVVEKSGKTVHAWAFEGDCDPKSIKSDTFTIEWPPRSGRQQTFPEADRAEFFDDETAKQKINPAQAEFLSKLLEKVSI
jgi:predicted NUDIX family NTP pyrophosphohydrolase